MKRRELINLLGGAVVLPLAAKSPQTQSIAQSMTWTPM